MKKILLSIGLLIGSLMTVFAQDTLTAARCNPVLHNAYTLFNCDTATSPSLAAVLAATGAGYVWDYSGLNTISTDTAKDDSCMASNFCSIVPIHPTLVASTLTNPTYLYEIANTDSVASVGYYHSANQFAVYTNPMITLKYPFYYNSTFVDAYAGSITYDPTGTGTPITGNESGRIQVTCDGYGTLKLPGSIVDLNTLRVKGVQTFSDSATVISSAVGASFTINTFTWYMRNVHSPLLVMSFFDQVTGPGNLHFKTIGYTKVYPLNINPLSMIENSLELFPNPASSNINVKFENNASGEKININVVDLLGRTLSTSQVITEKGTQQISLDVTNYPKGMYLINLRSGNESVTRRVSVQ